LAVSVAQKGAIMKSVLLLCLLFLISAPIFAENETEIARLNFGLGAEFKFGVSLANSVMVRHGDFGFGGFWGINWGAFAPENRNGLIVWSVYLSYEYPGWFGVFFSYGINHDQHYPYIYIPCYWPRAATDSFR